MNTHELTYRVYFLQRRTRVNESCRLPVLGFSLAPFLGYVIESRAGRDRARIQFEQFKSRQIKNRESLCRILHARVINSRQGTR